jgi:hypothetical protein
MNIRRVGTIVSWMAALAFVIPAYGQEKKCSSIGGVMITNLGVVDQETTMGVAMGDLKGAVAATIQSVTPNSDGTVSFTVQHHFVTETGDIIFFNPATAVTLPVSATRYAVLDYPVTINGGTGKYAHATGQTNAIGAVDLGSGQTVFRYSGKLCLVSGN